MTVGQRAKLETEIRQGAGRLVTLPKNEGVTAFNLINSSPVEKTLYGALGSAINIQPLREEIKDWLDGKYSSSLCHSSFPLVSCLFGQCKHWKQHSKQVVALNPQQQ